MADREREFGLQALMTIVTKLVDIGQYEDAMYYTKIAINIRQKLACKTQRDLNDDIIPSNYMENHLIEHEYFDLLEKFQNDPIIRGLSYWGFPRRK